MKQEDTKQRILDKALELFSTQGYDSVSVGEIAQAVGIKAPSLYNHFPGKQAIFDAIVEALCSTTTLDPIMDAQGGVHAVTDVEVPEAKPTKQGGSLTQLVLVTD